MSTDLGSLWPVYEFRPEGYHEKREWRRYNGGQWIDDDGEWDIAFITKDLGAPIHLYFDPQYQQGILWSWLPGHWSSRGPNSHPNRNPWHYMLREGYTVWAGDWGRSRHPNYRVSDMSSNELCQLYRCANGRGPKFQIGDPWIARGLLRRQDTKEVVVFPESFNCMYCGLIELPNREAA